MRAAYSSIETFVRSLTALRLFSLTTKIPTSSSIMKAGCSGCIDAFTESAYFPYSTHHDVAGNSLNYIRNSVKVVIDAYNGTVRFYVFDNQDPTHRRLPSHLSESLSGRESNARGFARACSLSGNARACAG